MKNILLFFIILLLTVSVNAQELTGEWMINFKITEQDVSEYVIYKPNEKRAYGNYISINKDRTFSTNTRQECGSSCDYTTSGTYEIIGKNHIRFILKSILKSSFCQEKDSNHNKDIGLYYIHREENRIRLLKSDGNIENDKQNVIYSTMITDFFNFKRMFPSGNETLTSKIERMSEEDMVHTYLKKLGYIDFEYLFSKNVEYDSSKIILIKIKEEYQYLHLAFSYPNNYFLSIFNYEPIRKIDEMVYKINSDNDLKIINVDQTTSDSNYSSSLLTVFFKSENKSLKKLIHIEFNKHFTITTTFYFEDEIPIYIELNFDIKSNPDRPTQTSFYIVDWNTNKYILKKKNLGGRKFEKEKWERIIDLSKESIKN